MLAALQIFHDDGGSQLDAVRVLNDLREGAQKDGNEEKENAILDALDVAVGWCAVDHCIWTFAFKRVLLQSLGPNKPFVEVELVASVLGHLSLSTERFYAKHLRQGRLHPQYDDLVVGDLDVSTAVLKKLGVVPAPIDYPACLHGLLGRRVWQSTVGDVREAVHDGAVANVFLKPAQRNKVFTGFVVEGPSDLHQMEWVSARDPVWCSDVVEFVDEARAYVADGTVLDVVLYEGKDEAGLQAFAQQAADDWRATGTCPAGCAIDVGRLQDGTLVVVEVNDGFGLGAYEGVDAWAYTKVILARWTELMAERST